MVGLEPVLHWPVGSQTTDVEDGDGPYQDTDGLTSVPEPTLANSKDNFRQCRQTDATTEPQSDIPVDLQGEACSEDATGSRLAQLLPRPDHPAGLRQGG